MGKELESIQTLNKLLVDVQEASVDGFLNTYLYGKDSTGAPLPGGRSEDYDHKVAFLHGQHKIFTQGELFGGSDLVVDNEKYQVEVNGTTYSLVITDGVLSLSPYTASAWGTCKFTDASTTGSSDAATLAQKVEYDVVHNDITLKITPSNKINYAISHGTTEIVLTGIEARKGSESFSYVSGGSVTITNGVISGKTYKNEDISGSFTLTNGTDDAYVGANTLTITGAATNSSHTYWNATNGRVEKTISVLKTQYAKIYYHEKGQSEVYVKEISIGGSIGCTVTPHKGYFAWVGTEYVEPTQIAGTPQEPLYQASGSRKETFKLTQGPGEYAWFATTKAARMVDGTFKPLFNDGAFTGGWDEYPKNNQTMFQHYSTNDKYYVYRTNQAGLGEVTWRILEY